MSPEPCIKEFPQPRQQGRAAREAIRDAILSGEIAPGERLDEPTLGIWLGVSGTPIKEALIMLRAEGLVETCTSRTPHVISPEPSQTSDALRSLGAVMSSTVPFAIEEEDPRIPAQICDAAASAQHALVHGGHDAHLQALFALHATLIEHCSNIFHRQLAEETLRKLGYHLRVASTADSLQRDAVSQGYQWLIEALSSNDPAGAELAIQLVHTPRDSRDLSPQLADRAAVNLEFDSDLYLPETR